MVLDDTGFIRRFDRSNLLGSIEALELQCAQALRETRMLHFPSSYRSVEHVVISGMGGSAIGGHIIQSLFSDLLPWPVTIVNDYTLPRFVGPRTLLLLSSYSGATEETLTTAREGLKRRAKLTGITTGGALGRFFRKHRVPAYMFKPLHNPCGQPRMGLGYSIVGQVGILAHVVPPLARAIREACTGLSRHHARFGVRTPAKRNTAKQLAQELNGCIPVLIGPSFLAGNLHTFSNQLNENAKTFAPWFVLPELTHHLLEGLRFPNTLRRTAHVVVVESFFSDSRIQERTKITKAVLQKNHVPHTSIRLTDQTREAQSFALLVFGSYVSLYAALLHRLDPSPIPFVDYLKKQLARRH